MTDTRERLTRSAGVVSAAVMASRLLGLVREMTLAHFFPTGVALDAFNAAFRIPNMLRDLFGEGALSKAFVTVFTETDVKRGEAETWRLASRVVNLLVVAATVATVLGVVFAPQLVAVMLPGEGFDTPLPPGDSYGFATKRDLTVFLTRVMFPFVLLIALAAVSMGILNSKGRFGVAALSSAWFNVGSLAVGVAGYFLGPRIGMHPVVGMAVGVLAGGLLQWLVQVPAMRRAGFRWAPELSLSDPGVRQIGRLIGPATIGVAAVQINVLVNMVLASQGAGWFSWLNVSFRLMYLPIGVFGVAISTANLPALARHAAGEEREAFRETLSHAMRLLLFLTIPSSVGLAVLSRPIIGLIYEHGAFTAHDADMAAGALLFYAIGLSGYSAVKIVTDAFYALNDTMTPLRISIGAIALNVALGSWLVFGLGWDHRGLALSMSIAVMLNFLVALAALRARMGGVDGRAVARTAALALAASAVMGAVCWAIASSVEGAALEVGLAIPAGVVVFGALAWAFRLRELDELLNMIRHR